MRALRITLYLKPVFLHKYISVVGDGALSFVQSGNDLNSRPSEVSCNLKSTERTKRSVQKTKRNQVSVLCYSTTLSCSPFPTDFPWWQKNDNKEESKLEEIQGSTLEQEQFLFLFKSVNFLSLTIILTCLMVDNDDEMK